MLFRVPVVQTDIYACDTGRFHCFRSASRQACSRGQDPKFCTPFGLLGQLNHIIEAAERFSSTPLDDAHAPLLESIEYLFELLIREIVRFIEDVACVAVGALERAFGCDAKDDDGKTMSAVFGLWCPIQLVNEKFAELVCGALFSSLTRNLRKAAEGHPGAVKDQ
jgi:hypothetical protein